MKAIKTQIQINSIRSKVDGSLGLTMETPELRNEEKVAFMELQNIPCNILIEPIDIPSEDILEVDKGAGEKTPSQRLRAIIFRFWKDKGIGGDFEIYYRKSVNKVISDISEKLNS